jgi:hypothetical protein
MPSQCLFGSRSGAPGGGDLLRQKAVACRRVGSLDDQSCCHRLSDRLFGLGDLAARLMGLLDGCGVCGQDSLQLLVERLLRGLRSGQSLLGRAELASGGVAMVGQEPGEIVAVPVFIGALRRRLLLRGVEAFGEPGEPVRSSLRIQDLTDKLPRREVALRFIAGVTSLDCGRFSSVGAQLGAAQLHAQPVCLGPPQHRGGVPAELLVVGVELRGGVLRGGQFR